MTWTTIRRVHLPPAPEDLGQALCGTYSPYDLQLTEDLDRVTCRRCQRAIASRYRREIDDLRRPGEGGTVAGSSRPRDGMAGTVPPRLRPHPDGAMGRCGRCGMTTAHCPCPVVLRSPDLRREAP